MHLHIGKNNILGRAFANYANSVHIISHTELRDFEISKFTKISISAFDPTLKKTLSPNGDKLLDILRQKTSEEPEIIFFSTARVLQEDFPERHRTYIQNKNICVQNLRKNWKNVSTIFLPNIIPITKQDHSAFIDSFLSNLKKNIVSFDCSENSYWNFVDPVSVVRWVESVKKLPHEILVINENPIYVSDFIEFAVSTNGAESLKITLGQKFLAYPEKLPPRIPVLLLKNSDIICKMNWLQNRMVN